MDNLRRLMVGWQMFADDNQGALPINNNGPNGTLIEWVSGQLNYYSGNPDNTNTLYLLDPRYASMGPYTRDATIYRCPADASVLRHGTALVPRVRSYSMNYALGNPGYSWLQSPPYREYFKISDITAPSPDRLWVFLDEHPDSMDDQGFAVAMPNPTYQNWINFPSWWHAGGVGLTYADGHAEIHPWADPRTKPPLRYDRSIQLNVPSPGNPDLAWVASRTSAKAD